MYIDSSSSYQKRRLTVLHFPTQNVQSPKVPKWNFVLAGRMSNTPIKNGVHLPYLNRSYSSPLIFRDLSKGVILSLFIQDTTSVMDRSGAEQKFKGCSLWPLSPPLCSSEIGSFGIQKSYPPALMSWWFSELPFRWEYVSSFPGKNPCFLLDFTEVNFSNLEKGEVGYPVGVENP